MGNEAVGFLGKETFTFHLYHTEGECYRKKDNEFSTDTSGTEDTYSCGVGKGLIQITFTQGKKNKTHDLVVDSIRYHKQMYFPCEVTVSLTVTTDSPSTLASDVKDYFKDRPIDVLDRDTNGTYTYLAKTYYVDNVQVELGETKTVQLLCKSLDAMLDKEKFCKTYRGAFASSILADTISEISGKLNNKLTYDRGQTEESIPIKEDEKGTETTTKKIIGSDNLCHLKYDLYDKKTITKDDPNTVYNELHHPYLVQYNESFHSFARRVAYRCGEMLYYENGTWTIGLKSDVRTIITNNSGAKTVTGTISSSETCCEKSVFAPQLFKSSYVTKENTTDTTYPTYSDPTTRTYISDVTSDEYLYQIDEKSDKISVTEAYGGEQYAIDFVSAFVSGTSSNACIRNALVKGVLNSIYWASPLIGAQKDINDDFKELENAEAQLALSHPKANKDNNLFDSFYDNVSIAEKKSQQRVVTVRYSGTLANAHLGDAVKLCCADKTEYDKDNLYIVTEMHGTVSQSKDNVLTSSHAVNAVRLTESGKGALANIFPPFNPDIPIVCKSGSHQAIIVDNADPLRMNRVRIRYNWDYDSDANKKLKELKDKLEGKKDKLEGEEDIVPVPGSPWIRVTTPFAEKEYGGCNFTLAVGSTVMVDYEDGNIERPYVDGSVMWKRKQAYKGAPSLEKNSSKSSIPHLTIGHNGQYIKFSDATKAYSNVSPFSTFMYNLIPPVGLIMNIIGAARAKTLPDDRCWAGGVEIGDALGFYRIKGSTATRNITIESPLGTVNINAFTGITINAPNGDVKIVGKNITLEAGNNITLKSGTNITTAAEDAMRNQHVPSALSTIGGMASMAAMQIGKSLVDSAIRDSAGIPIELSKVVDVTFLRNMWECLMRPVEGTALIKSKRNVMMEIGNGRAIIPEGDQSTAKFLDFGKGKMQVQVDYKKNSSTKDAINEAKQNAAKTRIIQQLVGDLFNKVDGSLVAYNIEKTQILDILRATINGNTDYLHEGWKSVYAIFKHKFKGEDCGPINPEGAEAESDARKVRESAMEIYNMGLEKPAQNPLVINELHNMCSQIEGLEGEVTSTINSCKGMLNGIQSQLVTKIDQQNDNADNAFTNWLQRDWVNIEDVRKKIRRNIIYEASTKWAGDYEGKPVGNFADNDAWTNFCDSLNIKTEKKSIARSMGMSVLDDFCTAVLGKEPGRQKSDWATMAGLGSIGKLINIYGTAGPRAYSEVIHDGGTLVISNTQGKTLRLDKDGIQWKNDENPNKYALLEYFKAQAQALIAQPNLQQQN